MTTAHLGKRRQPPILIRRQSRLSTRRTTRRISHVPVILITAGFAHLNIKAPWHLAKVSAARQILDPAKSEFPRWWSDAVAKPPWKDLRRPLTNVAMPKFGKQRVYMPSQWNGKFTFFRMRDIFQASLIRSIIRPVNYFSWTKITMTSIFDHYDAQLTRNDRSSAAPQKRSYDPLVHPVSRPVRRRATHAFSNPVQSLGAVPVQFIAMSVKANQLTLFCGLWPNSTSLTPPPSRYRSTG